MPGRIDTIPGFASAVPRTPGERSSSFEKVSSLFPSHLQTSGSASRIIDLLEDYYRFLNEEGLPSFELKNIVSEHDIDRVSEKYLNNFQNEIAKSVPNSRVIDRVTLYKYIVQYYKERSTEDSIISFFRIFLGAAATVYFPGEDLLRVSAAENSFPSSQKKIQDSRFWQQFSYVIRTDVNSGEWIDSYLRFVHPAGLRLFIELILEAFARNEWLNEIQYSALLIQEEFHWIRNLLPAYRDIFSSETGQHLPKFQPGWLEANLKLIRLILGQEDHLAALQRINEDGSTKILWGDRTQQTVSEIYYIGTEDSPTEIFGTDDSPSELFTITEEREFTNLKDDEWVRRVLITLRMLATEAVRDRILSEFDSLTMHRGSNKTGLYSLLDLSLEEISRIKTGETTEHFHNFNLTSIVLSGGLPPQEGWSFATLDVIRLGSTDQNYVGSDAELGVTEILEENHFYSTSEQQSVKEEI